jgi:hypothetical protein
MKKLGIVIAIAAASFAAPVQAQDIQGLGILALDPVAEGNTVLTLKGKSVVKQQADVAVFSAWVTTTGATAEEALRANAAQMQAVLAAARKLGIAEADIRTNQVSIVPVMDTDYNQYNFIDAAAAVEGAADAAAAAAAGAAAVDAAAEVTAMEMEIAAAAVPRMPKIVGYRAANAVTIKQRKLDDFGKVIDALVKAGANTMDGPTFKLEDSDATEQEARAGAIADARKRAEFYAAAAGLKVVRIVMIDEGRTSGLSSAYDGLYDVAEASAYGYASTPIASGELTITGSIGMLFELAPQ